MFFSEKRISRGEVYPLNLEDRPILLQRIHEMAIAENLPIPEIWGIKNDPATPISQATMVASTPPNNIIINERSLSLFDDRELAAVIAHEFGHLIYYKRHYELQKWSVSTGVAAGIATNYATKYIAEKLSNTDRKPLTRREAFKAARDWIVPAAIASPVVGLSTYEYMQSLKEFEADEEAIRICGDKKAVLSALQKLYKLVIETNDTTGDLRQRINRVELKPFSR